MKEERDVVGEGSDGGRGRQVEDDVPEDGVSGQDVNSGGKGATLSKTPRGLKGFTRSAVNQRGNLGSRDGSSDKANEGRLKYHLF